MTSRLVKFALALFLLGGCDALVGGRCKAGFQQSGEVCVPIDVAGPADGGHGGSQSSSSSAGAFASMGGGGEGCEPPFTVCPGGCVDTSSDPHNCGTCGNECSTGICADGLCGGTPVGHVAIVGMTYETSNSSTRQVLGNAVFLSPKAQVRVLEFSQYADPLAAQKVNDVVVAQAVQRGKVPLVVTASGLASLMTELKFGNYDTLLVHDLAYMPNDVATNFGGMLEPLLVDFFAMGGTMVLLAASQPMVIILEELALLSFTTLDSVTSLPMVNATPTDALAVGLQSPMLAPAKTVAFGSAQASTDTVFVVTDEAQRPIVLHQVVLNP